MNRRTLWLSSDEWECCGKPFTTGDVVSIAVWPVAADREAWLIETVGSELTAQIDAVEQHHDGAAAPDRLSGTVVRSTTVSVPSRLMLTERPPLPPGVAAPGSRFPGSPDSPMFAELRPSRYVMQHEVVPGPPVVRETPLIPPESEQNHAQIRAEARAAQAAEAAALAAAPGTIPPPGEVELRLIGYLVELDVGLPDPEAVG
jgi:hypothetical protein